MGTSSNTDPATLIPDLPGFNALGLGQPSLQVIAGLGYDAPTAVQARAIPLLLAGRDIIAQAPTGTGKTAAYGLPIMERLDEQVLSPQSLVLVPTRELAIQVAEALHALGKYRQVVTLPIYGGAPYDRQLRALSRGVQVVVGTPGRLIDHLGRGTLVLDSIRLTVIDEADEMLAMGFVEDIESILGALPPERQTALFSATMPARIRALAGRYLKNPEQVRIEVGTAVAPRVRQVYYEAAWQAKPDALARILELESPESAIVFVRTRRDADVVADHLNGLGYIAQAIHGDISQAHRERVLERFRTGHTDILVGTDVAARGLDIPAVSHVFNYDLPADAEAYVHRIGRTGRAGQSGEAVTLVTPRERRQLTMIERGIHRRLQPLRLPTPADIAVRRREVFRDQVLKVVDAGELDSYLGLVEDLAATHDVAELAAAAFKMASERTTGSLPRRPSRASPEPSPAPERRGRESMARLFLRVGKRHGVRPADLVGAITNEAGIAADAIGDINLFDTFGFVDVAEGLLARVETALNRTLIRGHPPRASLAIPPTTQSPPGNRPRAGADPRSRPDRQAEGGREPGRRSGAQPRAGRSPGPPSQRRGRP